MYSGEQWDYQEMQHQDFTWWHLWGANQDKYAGLTGEHWVLRVLETHLQQGEMLMYTCQVLHIIHESRASGSKTSITCIQDNFSCLTHNSGNLGKIAPRFRTFVDHLNIFGNLWQCSEVIRASSVIFGSRRNIFGNVQKSSEFFSEIPVIIWLRYWCMLMQIA